MQMDVAKLRTKRDAYFTTKVVGIFFFFLFDNLLFIYLFIFIVVYLSLVWNSIQEKLNELKSQVCNLRNLNLHCSKYIKIKNKK